MKKGPPDTSRIKPSTEWQQAAIEEFEEIIRNGGVPARESLWESIKQKHAPPKLNIPTIEAPPRKVVTQVHNAAVVSANPLFNHTVGANRRGVDDENFREWLRHFFNEAKKLPQPRITQSSLSLSLGRASSYLGVYLVSPERGLTRDDVIKIGKITRQDLRSYLLPDVSSQKDPDTRSR